MNKKLSEHFNNNEFACHCGCGACEVSPELVIVLEDLRVHFNAPVNIVSGRRCVAHNASVGGVQASQHLFGMAADIQITTKSPAQVADYLEAKYPGRYGIGRYANFTHIDARAKAARWQQ